MTRHGGAAARILAALAAALTAAAAAAAPYPDRPIRFIVPFAPGGGNDLIARQLGARLAEAWGQQIVVDNRGGAGGNIAAETAARSNPDGYTLFLFNSANAIAPSLYKRLGYDPVKDFEPVILAATAPFVMVVHPSTPAQSVKDLIALAKAKPDTLTYASGGNGSATHLSAAMFTHMAGIQMAHVPYKGAGPAFIDLLAGQVTLYFSSIPPAIPHVKTGRVRVLAITSAKRFPLLPEYPTLAESGLKGYQSESTYGITAPARTPPEIVKKLNAGFGEVLKDATVRSRLESQGAQVGGGSAQDYGQFIKAEVSLWAKVVKASGARID
jgi:tripartite-type tricarboxylate transporter receptor subunit TctC